MSNPNVPPAQSVWAMMPRLTALTAVLCLLVLAGCQGDRKVTIDPEPPKPESPAKPTATTDASKPGESPSSPAGAPTKSVANPESFKVKPGKDLGYASSKMSLVDLGKKTDAGIMGLQNGKAVVTMQYESAKGNLNGEIDIKVRDKSTYMVEYMLPKTEAARNRLIANGSRKMVYIDHKWAQPTPRDTSKPMEPQDIDAWIANNPAEIMSGLQDGAPVWSRLLGALQSDPNRTTTIEEQQVTVAKVTRPLYRVVSRRKDAEGEVLEIVIDGLRWLPLTVKATSHDEDKAPLHLFWTANWLFGGTFPDSDFTIPVK